MNETAVIGIDVGSFYTKIAILDRVEKRNKLLARSSTLTKGIERGYITSLQDVKDTLIRVISTAERQYGKKISEVYISASGIGLESRLITATTVTTLGSGEVTDLDITKCTDKASERAMRANKRIIKEIILGFTLDGQTIIGSPVGMKGKRLEVHMLYIDFPSNIIDAYEEIFHRLGIDISGIIPSPFAASCVTLSDIERKVGSVLLDIGSDSSSMLVYEHDTPILVKSLPFGSAEITNALALGLKISVEEAENIKQGGPLPKDSDRAKVDSIIKKRSGDFFALVNNELDTIGKKELLPAGVILVGGGSLIKGLDQYAREYMKIPARKGSPKSIKQDSDEKEVSWAVAYGLCVVGHEQNSERGSTMMKSLGSKIKNLFKQFLV